MSIVLLEIDGYRSQTVFDTYRFATKAYCTLPTDEPPNVDYIAAIDEAGAVAQFLFKPGGAGARANPEAEVGAGFVELRNNDGSLNGIFDNDAISFREHRARILEIEDDASYATATLLFEGSVSQIEPSSSAVVVGLKDLLYSLASPHLTTTYAGNNSLPAGVEGSEDIKGKLKPVVYGKVLNVAPIMVNTSKLIYQFSTRALQSIVEIRDGGDPVIGGSNYTDQADMEATAPSAGQYRAWLAGGMIRLGSAAVHGITGDVTADSSGNSTAAQLIETLATDRGWPSGDINAADLAKLDTQNSAVLGVWVSDDRDTLSIISEVARSVGAHVLCDRGELRVKRFDAPLGGAEITVDPADIANIVRVQTGEDLPVGEVRVKFARYYQTQSKADLASSVSEADRNDFAEAWRVAPYSGAPSPNPYKRTLTMERETLMTSSADAATEAARLHALTIVPRRTFMLKDVTLSARDRGRIAVGQTIGVRWNGLGFDPDLDTMCVVTAIVPYYGRGTADITVWR